MGKLFDNLTKPGVVEGGKTTYAPNDAAAGIDLAGRMRKLAQPATSVVPTMPTEQGPEAGMPSFAQPQTPAAAVPKLVHPDFVNPQDDNRPLTTKGMILATVLRG